MKNFVFLTANSFKVWWYYSTYQLSRYYWQRLRTPGKFLYKQNRLGCGRYTRWLCDISNEVAILQLNQPYVSDVYRIWKWRCVAIWVELCPLWKWYGFASDAVLFAVQWNRPLVVSLGKSWNCCWYQQYIRFTRNLMTLADIRYGWSIIVFGV